jgi:phage baseplate assembly protein W
MNLAFPYHTGRLGRTASAGRDAHVREMIEQLIFTNHGERVNRPEFGSGVLQLVFAPNSPELAATVQFTLQTALQMWLGHVIEVRDLSVLADDAKLTIALKYLVLESGTENSATFTRSV